MIIDVNSYVGSWPYWNIRYGDPEMLAALASKHGITHMAICSTRAALLDWVDGNEATFELCKGSRLFVPIATVSPFWVENVKETLEEYKHDGMRAIKLFPTWHGYPFGEYSAFTEILEWLDENKTPILYPVRLFLNWGLPANPLQNAVFLARHCPNCAIVVSGVNYEVPEAISISGQHSNLFFDLSCMSVSPRDLIKYVGVDKVLYGSGLPFNNPGPLLAQLNSDQTISSANKERILWRNTSEILSI